MFRTQSFFKKSVFSSCSVVKNLLVDQTPGIRPYRIKGLREIHLLSTPRGKKKLTANHQHCMVSIRFPCEFLFRHYLKYFVTISWGSNRALVSESWSSQSPYISNKIAPDILSSNRINPSPASERPLKK